MILRLKDMREEKDKNQIEIANVLSVSQATYSRYENGKLDIPMATISCLARYYNVSVDYLLGLTDDSRPYKRTTLIE